MFCQNCGAENNFGAHFCSACGANLLTSPDDVYTPDKTLGEIILKTDGRLNRKRYLKRFFIIGVMEFLFIMLLAMLFFVAEGRNVDERFTYAYTFVLMIFLVPQYCLDVRRLHDLNRGSFLAVLSFLCGMTLVLGGYTGADGTRPDQIIASTVSCVVGFYLLFAKGKTGKNQYGADPLGQSAPDDGPNWELRTALMIIGLVGLIIFVLIKTAVTMQMEHL